MDNRTSACQQLPCGGKTGRERERWQPRSSTAHLVPWQPFKYGASYTCPRQNVFIHVHVHKRTHSVSQPHSTYIHVHVHVVGPPLVGPQYIHVVARMSSLDIMDSAGVRTALNLVIDGREKVSGQTVLDCPGNGRHEPRLAGTLRGRGTVEGRERNRGN